MQNKLDHATTHCDCFYKTDYNIDVVPYRGADVEVLDPSAPVRARSPRSTPGKDFSSAEVRTRHLQPDTEIGGDEVHEAKPGGELPPVDVHLLVQEDKVHLEEDENKLETGTQEPRRKVCPMVVLLLICVGLNRIVSLVFT